MAALFRPVGIAALVVTGACFSASAQEQLYRTAEVASGKQTRIAIYGNVSKECTAGQPPDIKVVKPPAHGTLAVRSGKTKPGSLARCPALEVLAQGVFYQPNPKYMGADEVAFEVKRSDGRNQAVTVKITVSDKPKPDAKPNAGAEL